MKTTILRLFVMAFAAQMLAASAMAASNIFAGTSDGKYQDASSWITDEGKPNVPSPAIPNDGSDVYIRSGANITLDDGNSYEANYLSVANRASSSGTLNITNGTLKTNVSSGVLVNSVGLQGTGVMNIGPDGKFISSYIFTIGGDTGGNGTVNINGGTLAVETASGTVNGDIRIGHSGGAQGVVNITNGGKLMGASHTNIVMATGGLGSGFLYVQNGTVTANRLTITRSSTLRLGADATLNLSATGSQAASGLQIAPDSTMVFELGADRNFKAIEMGSASITLNSGAFISLDVTNFEESFTGSITFDLMNFSATATNTLGAPAFTVVGLELNSYLSDAVIDWKLDGSLNKIGIEVTLTSIPEPSTYALIFGMAVLLIVGRRRYFGK